MSLQKIIDPFEESAYPEDKDIYKAQLAELTGKVLLFVPEDLNVVLADITSAFSGWDPGVSFSFGPEALDEGVLSDCITCYEWMRGLPAFVSSQDYKLDIGTSENQHSIHRKDGNRFASLQEVEKAVEFVRISLTSALASLGIPFKILSF